MKRVMLGVMFVFLMVGIVEAQSPNQFWSVTALTGAEGMGDTGGIPIARLTNGAACLVRALSGETATGYFYIYDADGTHSTSSDGVSRIIANGATGCWHLVNLQAASVTTNAADLYRYWRCTNSGDLTAGERAEGKCWWDTSLHVMRCVGSDGSTVVTVGP